MSANKHLLSFSCELDDEKGALHKKRKGKTVPKGDLESDSVGDAEPSQVTRTWKGRKLFLSVLSRRKKTVVKSTQPECIDDKGTDSNKHTYSRRFSHLFSRSAEVAPHPVNQVRMVEQDRSRSPMVVLNVKHGEGSNMGKRPSMEDTNLTVPDFHKYFPASNTTLPTEIADTCNSVLYSAIFDGHCGSKAAFYARTHLHRILKLLIETECGEGFQTRINRGTALTNKDNSLARYMSAEKVKHISKDQLYEGLFVDAFLQLDKDFLKRFPGALDGSTALVCAVDMNSYLSESNHRGIDAVASSLHLAHVGDTRAVLGTARCLQSYLKCFGDSKLPFEEVEKLVQGIYGDSTTAEGHNSTGVLLDCIALTQDHKPDRPDELERIQQEGGRVIRAGVPRVGILQGNVWLAVSRALGNSELKKYAANVVTAVPECVHHELKPFRDAFVVLASDGVWDVCTNQEVVDLVASHYSSLPGMNDSSTSDAVDAAANMVIQHALRKGATDNVTCIVLEFRWGLQSLIV